MISIVSAYYNRKNLLINTLNSIKKHSNDIEFIIVDDCSDDEHRLENLIIDYPFLKIIRLEKKDKWYTNPCIPFNIGFKEAKGDIIIMQNPECYHLDDIITYTKNNLGENDYFSFSCYSLTEEKSKNIDLIKKENLINKSISHDGDYGWYNHSIYRPVGYHFCSAIHKKQLDDLGGFDERYANGIAYDDNEILYRIKKKGLNFKIIDDISVLHQWHYNVNNYQKINARELINRNQNLFYNVTMKEITYKANENK